MNTQKTIVAFIAFLLFLVHVSVFSSFAGKVNSDKACCVCGRKHSHGKTTYSERFYEVMPSSLDFSSCFGLLNNPNGVLCSGCYRVFNRYKISKKASVKVSKQQVFNTTLAYTVFYTVAWPARRFSPAMQIFSCSLTVKTISF